MKQEQQEIADVLMELGLDERLVHFMTDCPIHRDTKTSYEK